jgi:hypothetical protein
MSSSLRNIAVCLFIFMGQTICFAQGNPVAPKEKEVELAGEFSGFGEKVPVGNYYFVKNAIIILGASSGANPQTAEQLEESTWDDLVLSFEAFRRGIKIEDKDFETEMGKLLANEKVTFDWKKDHPAFGKWAKDKTGEPADLFSNQMRHLMQLKNLRKQVMEEIKPIVTEEEAHQEYLNEYNTLELELAQFDNKADAEAFYKKVKGKLKLWQKEAKNNPKLLRRPGFVALEFLMDMWQLPKDDLYKMLKMDVDSIYPAIPIYGGKFGVVRILKKRVAQEAKFPEVRQSYYKQVETKKKYEGLNSWIKRLKTQADIKVYKQAEILSLGEKK